MLFLKPDIPDDQYTKDFMILVGLIASQVWFEDRDFSFRSEEGDNSFDKKILLLQSIIDRERYQKKYGKVKLDQKDARLSI